jgi:hypothetical protein
MRAARYLLPHRADFSSAYEIARAAGTAGEGGFGCHLADFSCAGVTENALACVQRMWENHRLLIARRQL